MTSAFTVWSMHKTGFRQGRVIPLVADGCLRVTDFQLMTVYG